MLFRRPSNILLPRTLTHVAAHFCVQILREHWPEQPTANASRRPRNPDRQRAGTNSGLASDISRRVAVKGLHREVCCLLSRRVYLLIKPLRACNRVAYPVCVTVVGEAEAELCALQTYENNAAAPHACSYAGVGCMCVSVTVLGIRTAVEERRVSCNEAMFSGSCCWLLGCCA